MAYAVKPVHDGHLGAVGATHLEHIVARQIGQDQGHQQCCRQNGNKTGWREADRVPGGGQGYARQGVGGLSVVNGRLVPTAGTAGQAVAYQHDAGGHTRGLLIAP